MAEKELIIVAGPNGAGKTAFVEEFLAERPCSYLSADRIAAELAPEDPKSARVAAGREFLLRVKHQLGGEEAFLVESTLSGRGFRRTLRSAKASGFSLVIVLVFLDSPDTCLLRIQERVRKGGHDVPENDVRRRFRRSLSNFWQEYRGFADRWLLVYNGDREFEDVAFGSGETVSVRNDVLYRQFLKLANIHA